jgi:hypothetical protein
MGVDFGRPGDEIAFFSNTDAKPSRVIPSFCLQVPIDLQLKRIENKHESSWGRSFARFAAPIFIGATLGFLKGNVTGLIAGALSTSAAGLDKYFALQSYLKDLRSIQGTDAELSRKIVKTEQDSTATIYETIINAGCFIGGGFTTLLFEKMLAKFFTRKIAIFSAQTVFGGMIGGAITYANPRTRNIFDVSIGILGGGALGFCGGWIGFKLLPHLPESAILSYEEPFAQRITQELPKIGRKFSPPLPPETPLQLLWRKFFNQLRKPSEKVEDLIAYLKKYSSGQTAVIDPTYIERLALIDKLEEVLKTTIDPSHFEFLVQAYRTGYQLKGPQKAVEFLETAIGWLGWHTRSPSTLSSQEIEIYFLRLAGTVIPTGEWLYMVKGGAYRIWERLFSIPLDGETKMAFLQRIDNVSFWRHLLSKKVRAKIGAGKTLADILRENGWSEMPRS